MSKDLKLTPEVLEFFDLCPTVMLLFEIDGYRIVAANDAAERKYGVGKAELATMTIMDLRPQEDRQRIARLASRLMDGADAAGRSRHLNKDGEIFIADVHTQMVRVNGRLCKLAVVHDVTEQAAQEDAARAMMAEAARRARVADAKAQHFAGLFNLSPGCCAMLQPETFEVVAANDGYLEVLGRQRDDVLGVSLLEFAGGLGADQGGEQVEPLRASLRRVARSGSADIMRDVHSPFDGPSAASTNAPTPGWTVVNMPVTAPDGSVALILHSLSAGHGGDDRDGAANAALNVASFADPGRVDVGHLLHENTMLSRRLTQSVALLRTTSCLLKTHVWRFDVDNQQLEWSDDLFDLFGLPLDAAAPTFDAYVAMVHPDDRQSMVENYLAFVERAAPRFDFSHRIVRPDGQVVHLKGTAERILENGRIFLNGVVADVTAEAEALAAAERQDYLLRIAGEVGRIGGWRVDLASEIAEWSAQTARVHESPETRQIGLQRALNFYPPEYRDLITGRVNACATHGTPFDEVLQIVTVRGNRAGESLLELTGRHERLKRHFQSTSSTRTHGSFPLCSRLGAIKIQKRLPWATGSGFVLSARQSVTQAGVLWRCRGRFRTFQKSCGWSRKAAHFGIG